MMGVSPVGGKREGTHYIASAPRCAQAVRCVARTVCRTDGQLWVVIRRAHVLHRPVHVSFATI
jgi:hypothetical protein